MVHLALNTEMAKGSFNALIGFETPFLKEQVISLLSVHFGLNRYLANSESGLMKMVVSLSMIFP